MIAVVLLFLTHPSRSCRERGVGVVIVRRRSGSSNPRTWRALARAGRGQVLIALVTLAGVVIVGVCRRLSLRSCSR